MKVTCPNCSTEFEVAAKEKKPRGQLAGLTIQEMTDEQLKREIINSGSVLYKAKQRNASAEIIAKNQARFDAAKAEKASRAGVAAVAASDTPELADAINETVAAEV